MIKKLYAHIVLLACISFCFLITLVASPETQPNSQVILYNEGYVIIPGQQENPPAQNLDQLYQKIRSDHSSYAVDYQVHIEQSAQSNQFPSVMHELRKRNQLTFYPVRLPWEKYLIDKNPMQINVDFIASQPDYPTKQDKNNTQFQKHVQFWNCQNDLRNNLCALQSGSSSERVKAFFEISGKLVPSSNSGLYEKGLKQLVDKFCSYNRSENKYRLTQIPYISYEESQKLFQGYLELFPEDWRIVRYNLKPEYVEKICDSWQMVQKGHEVGGLYNSALIRINQQMSAKDLYENFARSPHKHDPFIANFYKTCISEKYSQAHQEYSNAFSVKNDPLYTSNNQELLLLRKEYADAMLQGFAPLQGVASEDIFATIPQNIPELLADLQDKNSYKIAIDIVLRNLEKNHPKAFLENKVLCVLENDLYVKYMSNEYIDPELAHIINYGLLIQNHDAAPEGVKELAKKSVRLARLAINENHVNHTNRNILAHTSYELLKHAKNADLMLHEMTDDARKVAHQNAAEKQEYMQHFDEQRKAAFEKTDQENYKQFTRKYKLHEDSVVLLCKEDLCPLDFENLNGTNLQHELMHETIEGLDALAILNKHAQKYGNCGNSFQNTVSTLTLFAQAAQEFNSECDITASTHCINTLYSGLEIAVEGARGIGIGLDNLGHMVLHPIETGKSLLNFGKSIAWGLQETARYCLFDRTFNQNRARHTESQTEELLEGVANYIAYSCYESSPGDYARIAAEQYTMLKAPGALIDAVCAGVHIAKNIPITAITESEIGLFLKNSMIDESYVQFASEISQEIKIGISEIAEIHIPHINNVGAFIAKTAQEVKGLAFKFTTQWQTINDVLPTLTDANIRPLLKNEEFVKAIADECTHLARLPNSEYLANIKSQYPKLIEIFKNAELPEIIAQQVPHGFTDEQIIPLLDHLFDIAIEKGRSADKKLLKVFGGHANVGGMIQDSEMLQFLVADVPQYIDGFYNKTVAIKTPLGTFTSYKTYFPNHWSSEKIVQTILDKLKEAEFIIRDDGKIKFEVNISNNLFLEYFFNKETKMFDSVFPIFKT